MQLKLDDNDLDILHLLMNDGQQSLSKLSKILDLPRSTVHAKIKRLERLNVIEKYTLKLNYETLDYPLLALVMINFDQSETSRDQETIAKDIASFTMVEEVHLLAGEWDIFCKVRVRSIEDLGDFSVKKLKEIDGVGRSLTYVVLKQIKDHSSEPYITD